MCETYYKNDKSVPSEYFQRLIPDYNTSIDHNHYLRHTILRLPMMKKKYYVQCTKYQYLKLIRETSQLDHDRCSTSNIAQVIAHFKYTITGSYDLMCNIRNCSVCERELH